MKNKLLSAGVLGLGLVLSATIIANGASAQAAPAEVQFPIAELGNCTDKDSCKTYCDDASHIDACLAFAEKNNLMSNDEIATAKKFMASGGKGPGGCVGKESCEAYCDDIAHIDACVAFAEKSGILPPAELAEAKQVQAAIAKGIKPPACRGKKECDAYCEDSSHMKECISFGEASGFLKGKELEDAKKVFIAIDNGAVPPPCRGKDACDAYCSEPDHMEACMTFAQAAGFMTEEEAQNSQKMLSALKKGVKPPACKGKEGCDAYCAEPAHSDECIQFAVAAGFMDEKDAEMAKRTGGKGPGGCVGKDACEAFCGDPANQQSCMDFAKENGMVPEGDARQMREGQEQGRMPPQGQPPSDERFTPDSYSNRPPPDGQRPPDGQFAPGTYPGSMPPRGDRPPGELFAPGAYPNQPPLEGTSGAYPNQQTQFVPGTEPMMPIPGGTESAPLLMPPVEPRTDGGEFIPGEPVPQAQPIEQTAPQSSNFNLDTSLAAVIIAFRVFGF